MLYKTLKIKAFQNAELNVRNFKKVLILFLTFAVFKSLTYFAPLSLNSILDSINDFGLFEYSLNLGQTFMGFLSMGFAGAYAYFIIHQEKHRLKPLFHLHFIIITFLLVSVVFVSPASLTNPYFGASIIGLAFANQVFISAVLKLSGKNNTAVIVDTGIYIVMAGFVSLLYFDIVSFSLKIWYGLLLTILSLISIIYHTRHLEYLFSQSWKNIFDLYSYGSLIVIAGPILMLITNSTRLYIEYFLTLKEVGVYSLYFRLSSLILLVSRVLVILLYKRMFLSSHTKLDVYYGVSMASIFLINIFIYFSLPYILKGNYEHFDKTYSQYSHLLLLCFFQIIFWIHTSLFEPILQRENKIKPFILLLASCLIMLISSFFLLNILNCLNLKSIIWVNTFFVFILFYGQQWILWKKNIIYKKSMFVHSIIGVFHFFTLLIL